MEGHSGSSRQQIVIMEMTIRSTGSLFESAQEEIDEVEESGVNKRRRSAQDCGETRGHGNGSLGKMPLSLEAPYGLLMVTIVALYSADITQPGIHDSRHDEPLEAILFAKS